MRLMVKTVNNMKRIFITSLLTIALAINGLAQGTNYSGTWYGTTEGGPFSMTYVFHIVQDDDSITLQWDSPMQKAYGLDATATITGDTLCIDMAIVKARYRATRGGDRLDGTFTQGDKSMRLRMTQNPDVMADRPQEALVLASKNKPYHSEEVTFTNGDITLAGTLTVPDAGSQFPAVVLLTGSGSLDRDENIFGHKGHLLLADALSRQGFAVLRYDKRGVGASTGGNCSDPVEDLAQDAMAAVRYAASRPEVDASRVGIVGHSEGAIIAIMNAAQYPNEIAYIVSMAGVGVPTYQFTLKQDKVMTSMMGVEKDEDEQQFYEQMYTIIGTETDSTALRQRMIQFLDNDTYYQKKLEALLAADSSYTASMVNEAFIEESTKAQTCKLLQYDPSANLKRIKCPMLAINGMLDFQVDCEENLGAISRHAPHATIKAYENLNHLFQDCSGEDNRLNYAGIRQTMAPQVLEDVVNWLHEAALHNTK